MNNSGRNDFVAAKVARDARNLYFYVRTKDPITSATGTNWMWLLLNVKGAAGTNWHGYNFMVNRTAAGVLEKNTGGWNWRRAGTVRYKVKGCEMELAIRRSDLGLGDASKALRIEFKWADNMQHPGQIEDFAHQWRRRAERALQLRCTRHPVGRRCTGGQPVGDHAE